eukprot:1689688-Rhodomonas_salina.1
MKRAESERSATVPASASHWHGASVRWRSQLPNACRGSDPVLASPRSSSDSARHSCAHAHPAWHWRHRDCPKDSEPEPRSDCRPGQGRRAEHCWQLLRLNLQLVDTLACVMPRPDKLKGCREPRQYSGTRKDTRIRGTPSIDAYLGTRVPGDLGAMAVEFDSD